MKIFVSFPITLFLLWITLRVQGVLFRSPTKVGYFSGPYNYSTKYFDQQIDHFAFTSPSLTFKQRYLINIDHWKSGSPIFFYCGNEGDITWFCNNTGFVWEIAPDYNAMIVFAEHRYYGVSLPFGSDSFKDLEHTGYLTSEQALADYAVLILNLREQYGQVPVVAFGGSYGGMLAAWMRMKYPSAVVGSIAASAPIWQFPGLTDCEKPYHIISSTLKSINPICADNIESSWRALSNVSQRTDGLSWLSTTFSLCTPLSNINQLSQWLYDIWFELAETNYPYPTDFLEPLPAWPLNETCQHLGQPLNDDFLILEGLAKAVQVYYNSTGQSKCLNLSKEARSTLGHKGWSFQACTEMVMPICSDGTNDVFPKQPWNMSLYTEECQATYNGITPRPHWIETQYGGKNLTGVSNIVFSNGNLDPWSGGGVLQTLSDTLIAVVIDGGAHHLDLRASNPLDMESVKKARQVHRDNISKWLQEF